MLEGRRCTSASGRIESVFIMAPALGGIKRYRDPSVCLSHGAAAVGAQLP